MSGSGAERLEDALDALRRRRSRRARRRTAGAVVASLAGHALILLAFLARPASPPGAEEPAVTLSLAPSLALSPAPAPAPPSVAAPAQTQAAASPAAAVPTPSPTKSAPRRHTALVAAAMAPAGDAASGTDAQPPGAPMPGLDAAQFGAASAAGSGEPAGPCDMARRVQAALRKDTLAGSELARARLSPEAVGRTLLVWNGDWVQSADQEGKGLAAIREAIMWEVGFAPEACRSQHVAGYVLLTLDEGPGAVRVALGAPSWRWSDLLGLGARGDAEG